MYPFLESIAIIDASPRLLDFHQQRLNETFSFYYPNASPHNLEAILSSFCFELGLFKLRFLYNESSFYYNLVEYHQKISNCFYWVEKPNIKYPFKFSDRADLDKVYHKLPKGECDFILTQDQYVTDAYYSNLIFNDGQQWYTPKRYLLNGVMRQSLLCKNMIKEIDLKKSDVVASFATFKRINAMLSFQKSIEYSVSIIRDLQ